MAFKKWIRNSLGLEEKEAFNQNVTETEKQFGIVKTLIDSVNKRINNLVLNSGGTSPNEVVDARTGYDGKEHSVLKERLDEEYQKQETRISNTEEGVSSLGKEQEEMQKRLSELYGGTGRSVSVFISNAIGNDKSGDGTEAKPYKTIQRAANDIPLVSSSKFNLMVEPGMYLEDVVISNRTCPQIIIKGTNYTIVDPHNGDTGVYVRSVFMSDCTGYCSTVGLTLMDAANLPVSVSTGEKVGILFQRCDYAIVNKCRNMENTTAMNYSAIYYDSSNGRIYDSKFSNQNQVLFANFTSNVEYANTNIGENNGTIIRCHRSAVYAAELSTTGTTKIVKKSAGQVFE